MAEAMRMAGVQRPLPLVDDDTSAYWTAGRYGVLRFASCNKCDALLHPPVPVCRYCRSRDIGLRDVAAVGTVIGATVNHQAWDPRFPTPYVIATVAIDADPRVRIVSNLVDIAEDEVRVGLRVKARFEEHDGVWLPLFVRTDEPDASLPRDETAPDDHRRWVRAVLPGVRSEDFAAITGIGSSDIGRRLMRSPLSLTIDAVTSAVEDAGLDLSDIDGLATYPGPYSAGGFGEGGIEPVEDALGLRPSWYSGSSQTFGPLGSVISAVNAIATGLARHVVCYRTVWQATFAAQQRARAAGGNPYGLLAGTGDRASGAAAFLAPYGIGSAANDLAMNASNHFATYGTTRETLAWIALTQRANAALNPHAIYRDPLTIDDYFSARPISTPFGLYDCDVPVDACIAVVVSHIDTVVDLRRKPVLFEATGTQITERVDPNQSTSTHEPHVLGPAAHLWSRTDLRPDDVDVALLYDGFTFNCLSWIEALGFCGIGEAKDLLDGGRNIEIEHGLFALNPHGGQLSAGRTHGMGLLQEAVVQLRGEAGARQRADARVAVVTAGGRTPAGAMLLRSSS